jgi:hypothetical protein
MYRIASGPRSCRCPRCFARAEPARLETINGNSGRAAVSEWLRMRTLPAGLVTPLLGSLGLHGCAVVLLLLAVRRPLQLVSAPREHADAWAGSAVEVDAIATPDGVPNIPNTASPLTAEPQQAANAAPVPVPVPALTDPPAPAPESSAPVPVPAPESSTPVAAPASESPSPSPRRKHRHPPGHNDVTAGPTPDSATATSTDSAGSGKPATQASTGAFGSTDLPPGVLRLPSAFTRAIPPATGADPIWQTLPTGQQRPFTIAVRVAGDGHIQDSKILEDHQGNAPSEQAAHLRERVVALLGAGLFALQNSVSAGYGVFRITITLSDRAVREEGAPAELVERGFEPPRGAQPGRAYFTLASGRHFEAKVEILNTQSR